ncbi:MAG: ABC transporter substrate-binding protein [Ruminococcus sp.]|nr:ABC transporter substrate-binding protein [Ruminococcus sp.]
MKDFKKLIAGTVALTLTIGLVSCGSTDGSEETSSDDTGIQLNDSQAEQVASLADQLEDVELENKTIKWIAHYDINPTEGSVEDPAIELFSTKYGGTIEWVQTTWDTRYDDIATHVMANDSPDFFPSSDMDTFPKGAIKGMFDPIDDLEYLDLDSDLWADTVDIMNDYTFGGERYICVIYTAPSYVCVYNRTTIEEYGYDDPAELYYAGEWDWDVFYDMCVDFTDAENDLYGIDGYGYTNAISETCGKSIISWEDGQLVNNMSDPAIQEVQDFMYELGKNNIMFDRSSNNWYTRGDGTTGYGLGTYQTLFIPVGLWALQVPLSETEPFGDMEAGEIMFCPMPKNPDSDTYYISSRFEGYVMCHNAPNPEGFACFMNCCMVCRDSTDNITEETLVNEYKWTQEMIDMRNECLELCKTNPVIDIESGISSEMDAAMQNVTQATMVTGGNSETWTQCIEEYGGVIDYLIEETNEKIKNVAETGEYETD